MSVELWIGKNFDTAYEREALDIFMADMEFRFGESDALHLVLADYYIDGRQVDLTILKRDAITVVELKECNAPFKATENGTWETPNGHILGTQDFNPYQQIQQYRLKWVDFLKRNRHVFRCLSTASNDKPFWYVSGIVAICPFLHSDTTNDISSWWFNLYGIEQLGKIIEFQTNRWMDFSDDELRKSATNLLSLNHKQYIRRNYTEIWKEKEEQIRAEIEAEIKAKIEPELRKEIEENIKAEIQEKQTKSSLIDSNKHLNIEIQHTYRGTKENKPQEQKRGYAKSDLTDDKTATQKSNVKIPRHNQTIRIPEKRLETSTKKTKKTIAPKYGKPSQRIIKGATDNSPKRIKPFKLLARFFISWVISIYVIGRIAAILEYAGHAEISRDSSTVRFFIIIGIFICWLLLWKAERTSHKMIGKVLLACSAIVIPITSLINVHVLSPRDGTLLCWSYLL